MDTMFQQLDAQAETLAALRLQSTSTSLMAPPVPQTPLSIPPSTRSMAREVPYLHASESFAPGPTNRSSPHDIQIDRQPAVQPVNPIDSRRDELALPLRSPQTIQNYLLCPPETESSGTAVTSIELSQE